MSRLCGVCSCQFVWSGWVICSLTSRPGRRGSSVVVALLIDIAVLGDLPRREACERPRRHIIRDDRPCRNPGVVADLDRSTKSIVDAGPDVAPDRGATLRL